MRRQIPTIAPPEIESPAGAVEGANRAGDRATGRAAGTKHNLLDSTAQLVSPATVGGEHEGARRSPAGYELTDRDLAIAQARNAFGGGSYGSIIAAARAHFCGLCLVERRSESFGLPKIAGAFVVLMLDDDPAMLGPSHFDPATVTACLGAADVIFIVAERVSRIYDAATAAAIAGRVAVVVDTLSGAEADWLLTVARIAPGVPLYLRPDRQAGADGPAPSRRCTPQPSCSKRHATRG